MKRIPRLLIHSRFLGHRAPLAAMSAPRAGTSLVEVLMSLLVMGVGVIAVATLFPTSILRSVQATQRTNATILRYSVEAALDAAPDVLFAPDWNGTNQPDYASHFGQKYIVDPWGFAEHGGLEFGRLNGETLRLARYRGAPGLTTARRARDFVCAPDSWIATVDGLVATAPASQPGATGLSLTLNNFQLDRDLSIDEDRNRNAVLDSGEDVNGNGALDITPSRIVLTGRNTQDDSKVTIVREITGTPAADQVTWLAMQPLPANFVADQARIETFEPRYSYLLTVRQSTTGDSANVDVVVFFRRSFDPADEQQYSGKYNKSTGVFTLQSTTPRPPMKKGGFVFDLQNARWHRIQKINERTLDITLESAPTEFGTVVLFPRGVIDVYPLGNKQNPNL